MNRIGITDYADLGMALSAMPFRSAVMMDRNRSIDGAELRGMYTAGSGRRLRSDIRGCSVLEFLVAFAERVRDTIGTMTANEVFLMFLDNMDIGRCDDEWFVEQRDPECYIQDRCAIMMDRRYDPDGSNGGLFVVRDHDRDIRPSEWWWQMQYWLNEQPIPSM